MSDIETINACSSRFQNNFQINTNQNAHLIQAKIFTAALYYYILESSNKLTSVEVKKNIRIVGEEIDKILFSDQEIMDTSLITYDELIGFAGMEIAMTKLKVEKLETAFKKGTLECVSKEINDLMFVLYIEPLQRRDQFEYFKRYLSAFLKYKNKFLNDYVMLRQEIISML